MRDAGRREVASKRFDCIEERGSLTKGGV